MIKIANQIMKDLKILQKENLNNQNLSLDERKKNKKFLDDIHSN